MNVRGTFVETQWMLWKASVKAMIGFGVGKTAVRRGQRTMITQDSGSGYFATTRHMEKVYWMSPVACCGLRRNSDSNSSK